jgi:16S rRNA processing protein RimM
MDLRKLTVCVTAGLNMSEGEPGGDQGELPELIAVARAVKTRGLRGEIVADLLTDFPERFSRLEKLIAVQANGSRESLRIEESWLQGKRLVLKFAGYDSIEAAQPLIGCELAVPEAERVELPGDQFYTWELIGCRVETINGEVLGVVRDVTVTGGPAILMIDGHHRELLIPMAEDICVEIDVERKLIRVDPPEGLLEL